MQRGLLPWVLCAGLLASLPLQPALAQSGGAAPLSLSECLHTALENNLDLVSAMKDPAIAEQEIYRSKAARDGKIGAGAILDYTEGNQSRAARILGLTRNTLREKIKRYDIKYR